MCAGDIASMVCSACHDWANDISEQVHGRMVKDREKKEYAMRIVKMRFDGKVNDEEAQKMFDNLFNA